MDHNLEDSLTMESIESMDFEHAGVEVSQEDISLEDSTEGDNISMDIDSIKEQPTLLEGGNEEVIVSDFIGDQFEYEEYSMQSENSSGANITIDANQLVQSDLVTQNDQIVDMQYIESTKPTTSQPSVITIKAIAQHRGAKKAVTAPYPRQVAIAPKPIKGASNVQYAIAPKPVAIVVNKNAVTSKTVPMKSVVQSIKGNTVLAQIGKQLVMVPAGAAGQKLKLASILPAAGGDGNNIQLVRCSADSAQLIANKGNKSMRTKFIVQGQSKSDPGNQPAVITKILPVTSAAPTQARYIMQQKTVPISIGDRNVVLTSPTKQGVKVAPKKQIISIKTESPKVVTSQANVQTKKVVITANPTSSQAKAAGTKTQGQRTQLHPINVPGKGIQYIKLVTNQPAVQKATSKPQSLSISGKNFVLTDSKGNILQMSSDKVLSTQPPPLLVTATTTASHVPTKGRKLVRIAPISAKSDTSSAKVREVSKMAYCVEPKLPRASQSLLMPRAPAVAGTTVSLEEFNEMVDLGNRDLVASEEAAQGEEEEGEQLELETVEVKPSLAALMSAAAADEQSGACARADELEVEYDAAHSKQEYYQDEDTNSMEREDGDESERRDESLIIVPSHSAHARDDDHLYRDDSNTSMGDSSRMQTVVSVEADVMPYLSPELEQSYSDSMLVANHGAGTMRPRKACNCTKSQCLKLYCDCFANGEFCNQCNCNNCFNNLDHEDTRQKAIRACLERNPNAFRPKIGKSKTGGPETVRRHNKGCNCKRSGCLKNYCECYEAKIACTMMCKCVGCRNIEETLERRRDARRLRDRLADPAYRAPLPMGQVKQPCNFMTREVIEAVAQCMAAAAGEGGADPLEDVLLEFSRCMADIISASHHAL